MTIYDDLLAAGLPVTIATAGHSPLFSRVLTPAEEDLRDSIMNKPVYRQRKAKLTAKNIPTWAGWSQADWTAHFTANLDDAQADQVTTLAAARVMIKRQNAVLNAMAKMLIAMRDEIWPDLPD